MPKGKKKGGQLPPHNEDLKDLLERLQRLAENHGEAVTEWRQREPKMASCQDLANAMTMETAHAIMAPGSSATKISGFSMSPGQIRTVAQMDGIGPALSYWLTEINGLTPVRRSCYNVEMVLNALKKLPETPEHGPTPWRQWLLNISDQTSAGIPREIEANSNDANLAAYMAQAVENAGRQGLAHWPPHQVLAARLQHQDGKNTGPIPVSQLIAAHKRLRQALRRHRVPANEIPQLGPVQELTECLRQQGFKLTVDAGDSGQPPDAIRTAIAGDLERLRVTSDGRYWHLSEASRELGDSRWINAAAAAQLRGDQPAEAKLAQATAAQPPSTHGSDGRSQAETAVASLAARNGTTPRDLGEYLSGRKETWDPGPAASACPQAANCRTACAAQRRADSPETHLPATLDGSPKSCRYRQFLERYEGLDGPRREAAAALELEAYAARRKGEKPSQPVPVRSQESTKPPAPAPEPEQPKAPENRPQKAASGQLALLE